MNNKRSWIQVAPLLAALVLVVDQPVVGGWPVSRVIDKTKYSLFTYAPENVFNSEKVNNLIGYSLPRDIGTFGRARRYKSCRPDPHCEMKLFELLAWTKDKNTPNAIVGKFSVNELLEWNNYDSKECTPDGLVERRKKCADVDPRVIFPDLSEHLIDKLIHSAHHPGTGNEPLDFLRYHNLHRYCTSTLYHFGLDCNLKQFLAADAKVKVSLENLNKFNRDVEKHIEFSEIKGRYDYKKVVGEVLMKETPSVAKKIRADCVAIIKVLGPFFEDKEHSWRSDKREYHEMCKAVVV